MVLPHGTGVVRISRLNFKSQLSSSLLLQRGVLRVEFAPDPFAPELLRHLRGGAATHKWIEHHVARAGACENAWLDECRREGCEVVYNDLLTSTLLFHYICHRSQFRRFANIATMNILRKMNGSLARQNTALASAVTLLKQPVLILCALSVDASFSARHTWLSGRKSEGRFARFSVMENGSRRTALARTILSTILMFTRR